MKIFTKEEFLADPDLPKGTVFIYPTDTIYGIGCDARYTDKVLRIRDIKQQLTQPFSVIAPSKKWITDNLEFEADPKPWLAKLPGPYTLIGRMKSKCVSQEVSKDTLGVRIPKNWFSKEVTRLGFPIVTTSVNVHGQKPINSIADLSELIKEKVDFIIEDGIISGDPSTIVNLTKNPPEIISRGR
jgi:L-threonylcarbamoyladenylate synthase